MMLVPVGPNVRLAVTDCNRKGTKTVVFLHGWPLSREIFEYQLNVLPRHGIRCVTLDFRGFGDSSKPWSGYTYNHMAEDLNRLLSAMDLKNVTLFGFSMGGAVSARYLSRYGNARVSRLVLCGAACPSFTQRPGYPYGKTVEEINSLIAACLQDRPKAVSDFGKTCFYSEPSPEYLSYITSLCMKAAGYSTIKALMALRDEDLRQDLPKINVPTAIFHGIHDLVCPFVFSSLMNQSIPGSFVVPFERSGHALFFDEKEKCNASLLEFIDGQMKA